MCYNVVVDTHKMSKLQKSGFVLGNNMSNNVGIIKEIDALGRIVIPKEYRERILLDKSVELVITEDGILIRNPAYQLVKVEKTDSN